MDTRPRPAPVDLVTLGYLLVVLALVLAHRGAIPSWWLWAGLHAGGAALVLAIAAALPRRGPGWRPAARLWYPLALVPLLYRALEGLVPAVHPRDWDAELARLDAAIFGVQPVAWIERLATPWLTELMQLAYVSFYALPVVLGVALFRRRRLDEFETAATAIVGAFFASFLLYFALPALGPRFFLAPSLEPLPTLAASAAVRDLLNLLEGVQRDAFPSGHAAVALVCLGMAWRYQRRLAVAMAPVVALMLVAAVYLRYHYVVDLVAGAALAAGALAAAATLERRRPGRIIRP